MDLGRVAELAGREAGLAVVATTRVDGTVQSTVVNAGVLDHPTTGEPVVGFVARGGVRKLANLRARPVVTLTWRSGWDWITVEGQAELADDARTRRTVYAAAVGGTEEQWAELDEVMAAEGHTAVLIRPGRVYGSG